MSGRQRWNSETGSWVEDTGEETVSRPVAPEPVKKQRPFVIQRPKGRAIHSATMARLPQLAMLLLGTGIVAVIVFTVLLLVKPISATPSFQDLGPGVSDMAGLKGHLVTRWDRHVQYKLNFEPLFAIYSSGFSYAVGHPPGPLWVNIRLLDATGYALCGKQIEFRLNPAHTASELSLLRNPSVRNVNFSQPVPVPQFSGQNAQQAAVSDDSFQNQLGDDGQIVSVTAQGVLPCSEDQYRKFNYWDFSTNFPSVDEQDVLMEAPAIMRARASAAARADQWRRQARTPVFSIEGDATATGYDRSTGMLVAGTGQSFAVIEKAEAATANAWAESNAQIHYKCDTLANCVLTRAGDGRVVNARSLH